MDYDPKRVGGIVGIVVDRGGRTLVAAQNGIFELRSHAKGDELAPLTTPGEAALREAAEREEKQNEELKELVAASRAKEASDGNVNAQDQQKVDAPESERQAIVEPEQQAVGAPVESQP